MQWSSVRASLAALAFAGASCLSGQALAQDFVKAWPAKPVMVIIPFPPGGSTEAEGRLYSQKMSENLGRTFILDYKPGASTTIGAAFVAKASPEATRCWAPPPATAWQLPSIPTCPTTISRTSRNSP